MKEMPVAKFVRDVSWLLGAQGVITVVAVATSVVMARALGPQGRGQFAMAMLLPSMLATFTEFGLGIAGTRFTASRRWSAPDILASHAFAGAVQVVIAGCAGVVLVTIVGDFLFRDVPVEFMFLGLFQLIPLMVAAFLLPILLGLGKSAIYSRLLALSSTLSFFALGTAWMLAGLDVRLALVLQIAAGFATSMIIYRTTRQAVGGLGRSSFRYLRMAYRFGAGVYASSVFSFANTRIILLLIAAFSGTIAVGLYTIAQTAADRVYLLSDAVGSILLPKVAKDPEANSAHLTPVAFRVTLLLASATAMLLAAVAGWLVPLLFTDAFVDAVPTLRILLVAVVLSGGWRVLSQDLNARGRSRLTAIVNGSGAAISLGLATVLLPWVGLEGAAWASMASGGLCLAAGVVLFARCSAQSRAVTSLFVPSRREREYAWRFARGCAYAVQLGPASWWALSRALFSRWRISRQRPNNAAVELHSDRRCHGA